MPKRRERIDRGIRARSADIFALCSWRELTYLSAPRVLPVLFVLLMQGAQERLGAQERPGAQARPGAQEPLAQKDGG